jgi:hypothetical protein
MSNTSIGDESSSDKKPHISIPVSQSMLDFFRQQREQASTFSSAYAAAPKIHELAKTIRLWDERMPKVNPELVQLLSKAHLMQESLRLPAGLRESMARLNEMNQQLANVAAKSGLTAAFVANNQLLQAAVKASGISSKVALAFRDVSEFGQWATTKAFELNGEDFVVTDIDFEEALSPSPTPISTLIVEESNRVKRIITDIFQDDEQLLRLEPHTFEEVVAELLRSQGFNVELTKRTRDGGYDLIAISKQGSFPLKFLVECKHYTTKKIGIEIVRNLMYVVNQEQANKGIIATTSYFSRDARNHAKKAHEYLLDLRDKSHILSWIQQYGESILHLHRPSSRV